jgi:hypothetical protein
MSTQLRGGTGSIPILLLLAIALPLAVGGSSAMAQQNCRITGSLHDRDEISVWVCNRWGSCRLETRTIPCQHPRFRCD